MIHTDTHPLSQSIVLLNENAQDPVRGIVVTGAAFRVEDWWDRLTGNSWMYSDGNPAAIHYALRAGVSGLPIDNAVVYGKIGTIGHLVHVSELVSDEPHVESTVKEQS